MEKQSIKRGPKRMTEKQLASNRRNASMAGRPAGSMNAEKIAFRDRFRAKEESWLITSSPLVDTDQKKQHRKCTTRGVCILAKMPMT
jgi:hypothetical protein